MFSFFTNEKKKEKITFLLAKKENFVIFMFQSDISFFFTFSFLNVFYYFIHFPNKIYISLLRYKSFFFIIFFRK